MSIQENAVDTSLYLGRLGIEKAQQPSAEFLRQLHRQHLTHIPYNNIDILLGIPYNLSHEALYDKVVNRKRGGFCYELAPLFAELLRQLGFQVTLVSARIRQPDGVVGPEFDHAVSIIHLEERWLADVGTSLWFIDPLQLDNPNWQERAGRFFRIQVEGDQFQLMERNAEGVETLQYFFTLRPRQAQDFEDMCRHKWTSPQSKFVRGLTIARVDGDNRIIVNRSRILVVEGQRFFAIKLEGPEMLRTLILEALRRPTRLRLLHRRPREPSGVGRINSVVIRIDSCAGTWSLSARVRCIVAVLQTARAAGCSRPSPSDWLNPQSSILN